MSQILDGFVTRKELAEELQITVRTLSRWENQPDGIPHIRVGGRKLYRRASVTNWLDGKEVIPNPLRRSA